MRRFVFVLMLLAAALVAPAGPKSALDGETVRSLIEEGKYDRARALLESALEASSKNDEAHYYIGIIELSGGNSKAAIDHLERANELESEEARYHFWLSRAYGLRMTEVGRFSQMRLAPKYRKQLERTLELDPGHVKARVNLCLYCLQAPRIAGGGTRKAMEHARILLAQDERQGRLLLAQIHAKEDRPEEAEAEYRKLVEKFGEDEDFFYLYNAYGYFLLGLGRTGDAVAAFHRQVELAPDRANAHDSLGEGLEAAWRLDESLAAYRRALEIDPSFKSAKKAVARLEKLKVRSKGNIP